MAVSDVDEQDQNINNILEKTYIGTVRASLSSLSFVHGRETDPAIVQHLSEVFERTRCRRYDPDNFIPVIINQEGLKKALKATNVKRAALTTTLKDGSFLLLKPALGQKFSCVHGRHRVMAAEIFLPSDDQWWTVRLFLTDSQEDAEQISARWKDDFNYRTKLSDGEIYRILRSYHQNKDDVEAYMTMLSSNSKRVAVRQLEHNKTLTRAFDSLLKFPGLWKGFELGNIQRHLALRFDEGISYYLNLVLDTWEDITMRFKSIQGLVCIQTVESLQLRAPGSCPQDRQYVIDAMRSGLLFPKVTDQKTRDALRDSLLSIKRFIPTIKSLHENLKYIEAGAKVLRNMLLGPKFRGTIKSALRNHWNEGTSFLLQTNNRKPSLVEVESITECWNLVYKQLWIMALRNFADLGGRSPRKETGSSLYQAKTNIILQYQFLRFAQELGIQVESSEIENTIKQNLEQELGRMFNSNSDELQSIVNKMLQQLPIQDDLQCKKSNLEITPQINLECLDRRWGVPFTSAYIQGKTNFYLLNLLKTDQLTFNKLTNDEFIRRDFFGAFFGPTEKFGRISEYTEIKQVMPSFTSLNKIFAYKSPVPEVSCAGNAPFQAPPTEGAENSPVSPMSISPLASPTGVGFDRVTENSIIKETDAPLNVTTSTIRYSPTTPASVTLLASAGDVLDDSRDIPMSNGVYIDSVNHFHLKPQLSSPTAVLGFSRTPAISGVDNSVLSVTDHEMTSSVNLQQPDISNSIQNLPPSAPRTPIFEETSITFQSEISIPEPQLLIQPDFQHVVNKCRGNQTNIKKFWSMQYSRAMDCQNKQYLAWKKVEEGFQRNSEGVSRFSSYSLAPFKKECKPYLDTVASLAACNRDIEVFTLETTGFVQMNLPLRPRLQRDDEWEVISRAMALLYPLSVSYAWAHALQCFREAWLQLPLSYAPERDIAVFIKETKKINLEISKKLAKINFTSDTDNFGHLLIPRVGASIESTNLIQENIEMNEVEEDEINPEGVQILAGPETLPGRQHSFQDEADRELQITLQEAGGSSGPLRSWLYSQNKEEKNNYKQMIEEITTRSNEMPLDLTQISEFVEGLRNFSGTSKFWDIYIGARTGSETFIKSNNLPQNFVEALIPPLANKINILIQSIGGANGVLNRFLYSLEQDNMDTHVKDAIENFDAQILGINAQWGLCVATLKESTPEMLVYIRKLKIAEHNCRIGFGQSKPAELKSVLFSVHDDIIRKYADPAVYNAIIGDMISSQRFETPLLSDSGLELSPTGTRRSILSWSIKRPSLLDASPKKLSILETFDLPEASQRSVGSQSFSQNTTTREAGYSFTKRKTLPLSISPVFSTLPIESHLDPEIKTLPDICSSTPPPAVNKVITEKMAKDQIGNKTTPIGQIQLPTDARTSVYSLTLDLSQNSTEWSDKKTYIENGSFKESESQSHRGEMSLIETFPAIEGGIENESPNKDPSSSEVHRLVHNPENYIPRSPSPKVPSLTPLESVSLNQPIIPDAQEKTGMSYLGCADTNQNGSMLKLVEYNGEINSCLLSPEQVTKRLEGKRWVMFVMGKSTTVTIRRDRALSEITKQPLRTYCLVEESQVSWWKRNGHGFQLLQKFNDSRPISLSKSQTKKDVLPAQSNTEFTGPGVKIKAFSEKWSLSACEQFANLSYGGNSDQIYMLIFHDRTIRSLHLLENQLSNDIINISQTYSGRFIFQNQLRKMPLEKICEVAQSFPVWLVVKERLKEFESIWAEEQKSNNSSQDPAPPSPIPAPPVTGMLEAIDETVGESLDKRKKRHLNLDNSIKIRDQDDAIEPEAKRIRIADKETDALIGKISRRAFLPRQKDVHNDLTEFFSNKWDDVPFVGSGEKQLTTSHRRKGGKLANERSRTDVEIGRLNYEIELRTEEAKEYITKDKS